MQVVRFLPLAFLAPALIAQPVKAEASRGWNLGRERFLADPRARPISWIWRALWIGLAIARTPCNGRPPVWNLLHRVAKSKALGLSIRKRTWPARSVGSVWNA